MALTQEQQVQLCCQVVVIVIVVVITTEQRQQEQQQDDSWKTKKSLYCFKGLCSLYLAGISTAVKTHENRK